MVHSCHTPFGLLRINADVRLSRAPLSPSEAEALVEEVAKEAQYQLCLTQSEAFEVATGLVLDHPGFAN